MEQLVSIRSNLVGQDIFGPNCGACLVKSSCRAYQAAGNVADLLAHMHDPLVMSVADEMDVFNTIETPLWVRINRMVRAIRSCPGDAAGLERFSVPDSPPCRRSTGISCEGMNAIVVNNAARTGLRLVNWERKIGEDRDEEALLDLQRVIDETLSRLPLRDKNSFPI